MRHETDEHRARERATADRLGQLWGCQLVRFPSTTPVDYYAERDGQLVALVEIKSRRHSVDDFPDVWLDAHKWLCVREAARGFGTVPVLVVDYRDGLLYCNLDDVPISSTAVAGRTDRHDPNDRRLAVRIPRDAMRHLVDW